MQVFLAKNFIFVFFIFTSQSNFPMKIQQYSPQSKEINFQRKAKPHFQNCLHSESEDKFLKTNISTKEKYASFEEDFSNYIRNTKKARLLEIQSIIQKYSPSTTIKVFKNGDENQSNGAAFVDLDLDFGFENDKYIKTPKQQTLFVSSSSLSPSMNKKDATLIKFLHEMTHVFQEEADDKSTYENFLLDYLNNDKSPFKEETLPYLTLIFSEVEGFLFEMADEYLSNEKVRKNPKIDEISTSVTGLNFDEVLDKYLENTIEYYKEKTSEIDEIFIKKYIILSSRKEKEAYKNTLKFYKKTNNKAEIKEIELRIKMYEKTIEAIEKSLIKEDNSLENKIGLFEDDILNYASENEKINPKDIEKIVQRYSPTTKLKRQSIFSFYQGGSINKPLVLSRNENGVDVEMLPKELYLDFKKPKNEILTNIVHEMTHIFQEESENRISQKDFYLEELKKDSDNFLTLYLGNEIFNSIEKEALLVFRELFTPVVQYGTKNDKNSINIDKLYLSKNLNVKNTLGNIINKIISDYKQKNPDLDVNLALDIVEFLAKNELEAYTKEYDFAKANLKNKNNLQTDILIKQYKKMLEAIEIFKNENNE